MFKKKKTYQTQTDEALLSAIQRGEQGAFDELFGRYSQRLYRFFQKSTDHMVAEDLVQETFLRIFKSSQTFNFQYTFKTWCFQIANNLLKNHYRDQSRRPSPTSAPDEETPWNPDFKENLDRTAFLKDLDQALSYLKPGHRTCFILRYMDEFSIKEIADICEIPEGTVRSRLHYTLDSLSKHLQVYKEMRMMNYEQ